MSDQDATLSETPSEPAPAAVAVPIPYKESDTHVPDPLYVTGHVDTTGTGGDIASRADEISPVFAQARAAALNAALASIDNDPTGAGGSVVLPTGDKNYEEAIADLRIAAEQANADVDQAASGLTPARAEAAQEGEPVNPGALLSDTHDFSGGEATAPATASEPGIPADNGASAEGGVPNVNPNADSVEQANAGDVAPVVVADEAPADAPGKHDDGTDGSNA